MLRVLVRAVEIHFLLLLFFTIIPLQYVTEHRFCLSQRTLVKYPFLLVLKHPISSSPNPFTSVREEAPLHSNNVTPEEIPTPFPPQLFIDCTKEKRRHFRRAYVKMCPKFCIGIDFRHRRDRF